MIKIGLIGCGVVTRKAHLPALIKDSRFLITSFCRRNKDKLMELKNQFPMSKCYGDYRELISEGDVDCVLVAADVDCHLEIAEFALSRKGLYIFLEKPVDSKQENIQNFIDRNKDKLDRLMIGFNKRFYPGIVKLDEARRKGEISNLISGKIDFITQQSGKGGRAGVLQNLIHTCDLICHIFGKPVDVYSHFSKVLNDDRKGKTITSTIMTEKGCNVSLFFTSSSNWKIPIHERIEVFDDKKGKILIEDGDRFLLSKLDTKSEADNWGNYPVINTYYRESNSIFFRYNSFGYEAQIMSFGDLCEGIIDKPESGIYDALEAQLLFEKIFEFDIQ